MNTLTHPELAAKFVDIVLSLNEYTKKRFGTESVSVKYCGIDPTLTSLDDMNRELDGLQTAFASLDGHAGKYMRGMVASLGYYLRAMQGDEIPYPELIQGIQQISIHRIPDMEITGLHEALYSGLGDLGHSRGTLQQRVNRWLDEGAVAPDRVCQVAREYLRTARADTVDRIIPLPLETGVSDILPVHGEFWCAYSIYEGACKGRIVFNVDHPWCDAVLVHLVCHEGYPGHQAVYTLWDHLFKTGRWPLEASFYLIGAPNNVPFEGLAECGVDLLEWADEHNPHGEKTFKLGLDVASHYLDLRRAAAVNAAYLVNTGDMDEDASVHYMMTTGLMSRIQAEGTYRFFTDPVYRFYYPNYYYGRHMIRKAFGATSERRAEFFDVLYHQPHTVETFLGEVGRLGGEPVPGGEQDG